MKIKDPYSSYFAIFKYLYFFEFFELDKLLGTQSYVHLVKRSFFGFCCDLGLSHLPYHEVCKVIIQHFFTPTGFQWVKVAEESLVVLDTTTTKKRTFHATWTVRFLVRTNAMSVVPSRYGTAKARVWLPVLCPDPTRFGWEVGNFRNPTRFQQFLVSNFRIFQKLHGVVR